MAVVSKIVVMGITVYVLLVVVIYLRQDSMIYFPNMPGRQLIATPGQVGLAFEEVNFSTTDDVKIHGWFVPAEAAIGTLLFFHGNAGNISHRLESIRMFNGMQLNVLIIDYRGYGQSEGKPGEQGTYLDAEGAWQYLTDTRGLESDEIIIFGRSLGSSIAAWLASQQPSAGLIVESGFSSVPSMAKRLYPFLPVNWLARFSYDTETYVSEVESPVLVIHSRGDEVIPFEEGMAVFEAAAGEKTFLEIRGGHNDGFLVSGSTYLTGVTNFVNSSLIE